MGQVKGAALREFLVWYQERHGAQSLDEAIGRLSPDVASRLHFDRTHVGVLPSGWYPADAIHALLDAVLAGRSTAEQAEFAHEGAVAIMNATLRGIYRVLFAMLMTPERYAQSAQILWNRFYDDGRVLKTAEGATTHRTVLSGWSSHHPFLCDMNLESAEAIYGAMKLHDVAAERVSCISRGGGSCTFLIRWRKE